MKNLSKYEFAKRVEGASVSNLYYSYLTDINMKIPTINEQQKIGEFFSKLDRQIELEEQKLAKLEEQKKGYMQKIFSQELRFKDENGNNYPEWIKTNLKYLVNYKNGKGYEKEVIQNGKYNIINLNSISTKGRLKDSGKYSDFEDVTLKKNDLIMILSDVAKGNLIGKTVIIDQDDKYLLNQRVACLRIKDESTSNTLFIYYFINYFRQYFINMSTGMSQLNINKSTVEDFLVNLPYIEEQNKIGNFLSNYDKVLEKQSDKIELLKECKKGLLQKMFV
ncbi:restriction endonuclease subunit S [Staphylococcus chromogenes]|uniref:restriction endonuclease subunit S n=1 Tax=Staphylococcus chromogenes TaxID=46126 RepID=UPI002B272A17|nr:restriction endonuclease subunit S [Staphylococcus chromogenes]